MSAAARGAAGYLYASGRLRSKKTKEQRIAERAAEQLAQDRLIRVLTDPRLLPATQELMRACEVKPNFNRARGRRRR